MNQKRTKGRVILPPGDDSSVVFPRYRLIPPLRCLGREDSGAHGRSKDLLREMLFMTVMTCYKKK